MSSLQERMKKFTATHRLLSEGDRVLLAVSGGIDSMVLLRLFQDLPFTLAVAHVNFGLRGKAAKEDAVFVREKAEKKKIAFHLLEADTKKFAAEHRCSVQEAARTIRYQWFEQLAIENGYTAIATAHHLDDSIETFFINLLRGSGIHGMGGIPVRNGKIIRPLLFADRESIERYAATKRLSWREDASNRKDDYLRNRIRHRLIPLLLDLQPSLRKVMGRNMELVRFAEDRFDERMQELSVLLKRKNGKFTRIPVGPLLESSQPGLLLQELLLSEGMRLPEPEKALVINKPGKIFEADGYLLVRDRNELLLSKKETAPFHELKVHRSSKRVSLPSGKAEFSIRKYISGSEKELTRGQLMIDSSKVQFPLTLRRWKPGDRIRPLGMRHSKKVSDLLTDLKMSLAEKKETCVLLSGEEIVCILGVRINELYKVTPGTKKSFLINTLP
ncbi:MAG: tRNA(Ile)-lysidine synthetase [Bacteroidota bacterium]